MDNVILKRDCGVEGVVCCKPPKKIKLSDTSNCNVQAKVISFPQSVSQNGQEEQKPAVAVSTPSADMKSNTVLENVTMEDCDLYTNQPISKLGNKVIRLTDPMYNIVVDHTQIPTTLDLGFSGPNSESFSDGDSVVKNATSSIELAPDTIQGKVDDAFDSISTTNNSDVKKAPYAKAKAKVEKYNLPTNMLSDNGLFGSNEKEQVFPEMKREMPIVVPVRERGRFLFQDFSVASESMEEPASNIVQFPSTANDDLKELLARVGECQRAQQASLDSKAKAAEIFRASGQALEEAQSRYISSNKALEEAKAKAYAYLTEMEGSIADTMKEAEGLRVEAEKRMEEARKIDAAAGTNEEQVGELRAILADVPAAGKLSFKTYSKVA